MNKVANTIKIKKETKMKITYESNNLLSPKQLEDLFLSVNWVSGRYPKKMSKAISNSDTVFTAWNGEKLIGLVNALDDGVMTALK